MPYALYISSKRFGNKVTANVDAANFKITHLYMQQLMYFAILQCGRTSGKKSMAAILNTHNNILLAKNYYYFICRRCKGSIPIKLEADDPRKTNYKDSRITKEMPTVALSTT